VTAKCIVNVSLTNPETVQLFMLTAVDEITIKMYDIFILRKLYFMWINLTEVHETVGEKLLTWQYRCFTCITMFLFTLYQNRDRFELGFERYRYWVIGDWRYLHIMGNIGIGRYFFRP